MKKIYFTLFFLSLLLKGFSTHIVGGSLTYTYNGGSNYTVMLKLYRDCSAAAAAFPATADITVLQANGSLFNPNRNFVLNGGAITSIPQVLPPCATSPSVVPCVEQRVYTATVSLVASPGGIHLYFDTFFRNGSISNIIAPGAEGATFYAYIPCYNKNWTEDFNLANSTTTDAGLTAWTRTITGVAPLPTAQVNNGQFQIISQSSASSSSILYATQVIPISTFTNGVNLSVNISEPAGATLENSDSIKVFYSINGGAKQFFPVNGSFTNDFNADLFATATGLVGNTIQIFVRVAFGATSPNDEVYSFDMVSVYDNTFLPNSNPSFNQVPPLLFCSSNTFTLSQSATDIDGDVLVYSMYTPYDNTAPTFSDNIASIATVICIIYSVYT